jgi:hypothetical protein
MRQMPGPPHCEPFSAGFLKHADEQTVVGLAVVLQAIQAHSLNAKSLTEWGVLAAPRFLGRASLAAALQRFAVEGAWGVSPHLIPHRSMHAMSGTISQALGIHGPNFGVGGGTESASEMMLAAATMIAEERLPGVWLILTGWDPEPSLKRQSAPLNGERLSAESVCNGVSIALVAATPGATETRLEIRMPGQAAPSVNGRTSSHSWPLLCLEALQDALAGTGETKGWRLQFGGSIELVGL